MSLTQRLGKRGRFETGSKEAIGEYIMEKEIKKEESQKEDKAAEKPLDKMTVSELREIAKEIPGATGVHAMKKDALLALVKEASEVSEVKEEKPEKKTKKKAAKSTPGVKELKEKVQELRKEKQAAREAGDRHGIDILRRRINRLKKRARKIAQA